MLILKKIKKDFTTYNKFKYPKAGETVKATLWKPTKKCDEYGLYGLPEGNGNWHLLEGEVWTIIECDEKDVVVFDYKCKFKEGKIVYRSSKPPVEFGNKVKIDNSASAYYWAMDIGNKDVMIDRITDSEYAYYWAKCIGNQNIMIDKVTNSEYAYYWAKYIGNQDVMINRIIKPYCAYLWARDIGNRDVMIKRFPEIEERLSCESCQN